MNKILQHHYGATKSPVQSNLQQPTSDHIAPNNANLLSNSNANNQPPPLEEKQDEVDMLKWIDQYNAPKDSIRMTAERFPKNYKLAKDLAVPLAAIIQPYYSNFKDSIPISNFGNNPIVRCSSCRAYINPFCQFHEGGSRWTCNICGKVEACPSFYYSKLNDQGERIDKFQKPELFCGSFDIKAGADYMSRPPAPPIYFFLIDVSKEAVQSGMLEMTVHVLKETITKDLLLGAPRTMVGIVTYDSSVHFYNLKQSLKQPHMIVVNDLENIFLPIPDELIINIAESKEMLLNLLDSLNNMFANQQDQGCCLSKAIVAAVKIFKHLGGKLIITQASENLINKTENNKDEAKLHILPTSPFYCNLSADIHHAFISVTLFIFSKSYKDAITLGELARYLNGDIFYYPDKPMRKQSYFYDFKNSLIKDYTWESVFRIRITKGWQISRIFGNFIIKSTDLLSVSNMDENKSFIYEFNLLEETQNMDLFSLQTALLYTTSNGERRIRCHNYAVLMTNNIQKFYDNIDVSTLSITILRQGLEQIFRNPDINQTKTFFINKCKEITNQSNQLKQSNPGEPLNIHDSIQSLPLNILGILKNKFLNGKYDKSSETDERNVLRICLNCMPIEECMLYFVPYLFSLLELRKEGVGTYDELGNFNFPSMVPLSFTALQSSDIYLMDEGNSLIIFVGKGVDPTIMSNIFGVSSIDDVKEFNEDMLYHNSKDFINERIYNLITELRARKSNKYAPLSIIKEGDAGEVDQRFFYKLIQDRLDSYVDGYNISYQEFYQMLRG